MKSRTGLLLTHALVLPLFVSAAFAQVTELGPADQPLYTQPAQSGQTEPRQVFAEQELDQMLAPIALYPDALLSQILMASTYPIEVVQAARWSRANPGLSGDAAVRAVEQQSWDPSVKSLVAFPQVISMMDEKLDWMERLGDAFLSQQQQVMDAVQALRQKAQAAGNLKSNEIVRVEPQGQTIIIEQANPQVVYVPYYAPPSSTVRGGIRPIRPCTGAPGPAITHARDSARDFSGAPALPLARDFISAPSTGRIATSP